MVLDFQSRESAVFLCRLSSAKWEAIHFHYYQQLPLSARANLKKCLPQIFSSQSMDSTSREAL